MLLLVGSLYGARIHETTPVMAVGSMQIAPFKNGLSLYQGYRGQYYAFSPFNDYLLDATGSRSSLITEDEANQGSYRSNLHTSRVADITNAIKSYFGISSPTITFWTNKSIKYTAYIDKNKLQVKRDIFFPYGINQPHKVATTLAFHGGDFVFDATGTLYNYQTSSDIGAFEKIYGIHLTQNLTDFRMIVPDQIIYIVNRYVSGTIVVRAGEQQQLYVDRNAKLIEIEETVVPIKERESAHYQTTMQVEVFQTPKEAITSL